MKKRTSKLLSLLLTLTMVLGMLPAMSQVAYAAGDSESDPVICTTYEEFKAAMEDTSIGYVKINALNDMISKEGSTLISGATVTSSKTLILEGSSVFTASQAPNTCRVDSLIYVADGGYLTVKGSGSLTFEANASNASNSVIHIAHDNANVFLNDGISLNGRANGAAYGRAMQLDFGNLTIWGGNYTGTSNIEMTGPLSALVIRGGNCKITKGTFSVQDNSSTPNECKAIEVPSGQTINYYLQVNSGYTETGNTINVFEVFTEQPSYTKVNDYGTVSFKLGRYPSNSPFLVAQGQKAEDGEYTAIFVGTKTEYAENVFQSGIYPTPPGQYRVAVKYGDNWFYSNAFTISYDSAPSFAFTTQPASGTAKKTEQYTFSWVLNDTANCNLSFLHSHQS